MDFTLIVLAGFYPAAQEAMHYADMLASSQGGHLVLLHVNRASLFDPYIFGGEKLHRQELADTRETEALLRRQARQLRAPTTVEMATDLLPDMAESLLKRYRPALFVLGRPAAQDVFPEQVSTAALELLRSTQLPVLVVPIGTPAHTPPQRVLIAADREEFKLTPNDLGAKNLLASLSAKLTVGHVSVMEDDAGCASALVAVRHSGLMPSLADADLRGYQHKHSADGVLAAIADTRAELLVLIARTRSYLGELFHHSVTAQVSLHSPVPVLLVPATEPPTPTPKRKHQQAGDILWPGL